MAGMGGVGFPAGQNRNISIGRHLAIARMSATARFLARSASGAQILPETAHFGFRNSDFGFQWINVKARERS
jgi:hypothetical protein